MIINMYACYYLVCNNKLKCILATQTGCSEPSSSGSSSTNKSFGDWIWKEFASSTATVQTIIKLYTCTVQAHIAHGINTKQANRS